MTQPLRIVFAGTPEFAARHLQALLAGADPYTLGGSVRVLHSGREAPVFGL